MRGERSLRNMTLDVTLPDYVYIYIYIYILMAFGPSRHRAWLVGQRDREYLLGSRGRSLGGLCEAVGKCLGCGPESPLEACRLHTSSGIDQVPFEACRLYASNSTDEVPLEACIM